MQSNLRFFLYIRKSTNDDTHQIASLDSQAVELRRLAKRDGLTIAETFEESKSARNPGRPIFNAMLDRIEKGDANALLTWDIDRLCRNPIDEGRIRWLLQTGIISEIRTPNRRYVSQDAGVLMAVEGGRASDHIIKTVFNLKRTIDYKLENGKWPLGPYPPGYVFNKDTRNLAPDPQAAPRIRRIFEEVAEKHLCLKDTSARLAQDGFLSGSGTPYSKSMVKNLLTNKLYIGIMVWKGETYEGKFVPIISPELFDRVQRVLKSRAKPRKTKHRHDFPFCGLIRCACGSMITAQWTHGHGGTYRYYRCTKKNGPCYERYIQEKDLSAQVRARLAPLALRKDEAETLFALISAEEEKEGSSVSAAIKKASAELLTIQNKLDRLTRAYLDPDESLDGDSFQTVKAELILQKTSLKAEKDRLQKKRINSWIEPARDLISTLKTLGTMPDTASPQEIANNLRKIGTNPFLANKTVTFSFSENFEFIPSLLASVRSASPVPDPKRCGDFDQSFKWCVCTDSNLWLNSV